MSILIDDLRDSGMPGLCWRAADEIEDLEKAYALLFEENSKHCTRIAELEAENAGLKLALNASPGLMPCRFALEKLQAKVAALTKRAEAWRHAANEWADAATNGPAYLLNMREGVTTISEALEGMGKDFEHCRAVSEVARASADQEPKA